MWSIVYSRGQLQGMTLLWNWIHRHLRGRVFMKLQTNLVFRGRCRCFLSHGTGKIRRNYLALHSQPKAIQYFHLWHANKKFRKQGLIFSLKFIAFELLPSGVERFRWANNLGMEIERNWSTSLLAVRRHLVSKRPFITWNCWCFRNLLVQKVSPGNCLREQGNHM